MTRVKYFATRRADKKEAALIAVVADHRMKTVFVLAERADLKFFCVLNFVHLRFHYRSPQKSRLFLFTNNIRLLLVKAPQDLWV
jgi:hypothetical protein